MDLISRALDEGIPGEVVLADADYGRSHVFRDFIRSKCLDYAVAVGADARVWLLDDDGRAPRAASVRQLGIELGEGAFRQITWRDGTHANRKLSSRFVFRRVKPAYDDGRAPPWCASRCGSSSNGPKARAGRPSSSSPTCVAA